MAAVLLDLADDCAEVLLPGGPLMIEWRDRSGSVMMTGPAEAVFDGVLTPDLVPAGSPMASTSEAPAVPPTPDDRSRFRLLQGLR